MGYNLVKFVTKTKVLLAPLVNRSKVSMLRTLQTALLSMYSLLVTKHITRANGEFAALVDRSGLFLSRASLDVFALTSEWSRCHKLSAHGDFALATRIRRELLERLYADNELPSDYFPPILSNQFFGPIGHHGFLGIHIAAQSVGLIPSGSRVAPINSPLRSDGIVSLFKKNLIFVNYREGTGWTELPNNWHIAERAQMIRGFGEFIEAYELKERVFTKKIVNVLNPLFQLDENYINESLNSLKSFGMTESDWFVGLHIRDGDKKPALRNQSIANYIPAIRAITELGGWVIRVGSTEMPELPQMKNVIDLVTLPNASKNLHPFVFAKAKFFIGTLSGPQYIPPLFGVPTILTNHPAVGRTALTLSQNSFTVPKVFVRRDGKKASLHEMLKSPFGFGELTLEEFASQGIFVEENSADDLKDSVIEMLSRISGGELPRQINLMSKVNSIRSQLPWTTKGEFSNAFLQKNEDWFLN